MYADDRLCTAIDSMVRGIDAPSVPITAIRTRMAAPLDAPLTRRRIPLARYAVAAAAVLTLFFAAFPKVSLAVVGRFETIVVDGYAAASRMVHRLTGWTEPPPPPKSLDAAQKSKQLSLAAAQRKVDFTIVPPVGVPSDAAFVRIATMPSLVYDYKTLRWSKGVPALSFEFRRSQGRSFSLMAQIDDPRVDIPGKYIWAVDEAPGGKVVMEKHEHFAWKNGDQMMSAEEDTGISAAEIRAIRDAMHGEPVVHDAKPSLVKRYLIP